MHATNAGEKRKLLKRNARELARDAKALQKAARIAPEARQEARKATRPIRPWQKLRH